MAVGDEGRRRQRGRVVTVSEEDHPAVSDAGPPWFALCTGQSPKLINLAWISTNCFLPWHGVVGCQDVKVENNL